MNFQVALHLTTAVSAGDENMKYYPVANVCHCAASLARAYVSHPTVTLASVFRH